MASNNFLKYTGITFPQLMEQINTKLASDPRFDNFRESAIAQTLVEIFAGTVDICNYYLERRSEECFFDTAKLRSSVIALSRSLGYDVQRPVPAAAKLKLRFVGNLIDQISDSDEVIQIPLHTVFTYEDQKYILKKTLQIPIGEFLNDIVAKGDDFNSGWISVDINGEDIEVVQGEIKEKVIIGETNPQVGSKFQVYAIDDSEFSNVYGISDYNPPITKIWVGDAKTDSNQYSIDRRSLINWESLETLGEGETANVCVVRTSITEGTEILFGDARYTSLGANLSAQGAITTFDNIYIQYLSTKGSKGNKTGLKDKKSNISGKVFATRSGQEVTSKIEFHFNSNPTGGSDMETIDEIRVNAPNIYYSLDRLVTKRDYSTYLKYLTNPINIKNAFAWGEQEESLRLDVQAVRELFNIVFFTCVGSLYNLDVSPYSSKQAGVDLDNAVLDFNYDPNQVSDNSYYNVFTKNQIVRQLREYNVSATRWQIFSNQGLTNTSKGFYDNGATTITINYGSNIEGNAPSISGTKDITIDISTLKSSSLSDNDFLQDIASSFTSQASIIKDERGKSTTNVNLNNFAFPNVQMTYDVNNKQFQIRHGEDDVCQIVGLSSNLANTMGYENQVGGFVLFSLTRELSQNIATVLDLLKERSQVTVNNVYISPLIHNCNITGEIYLNSLFDREAEKIKINDSIYSFLNLNADFNEPIYLSNIVEIIDSHPSVKYCNINFVPEEISGTFYTLGNIASVESFSWDNIFEKESVYQIVQNEKQEFQGKIKSSRSFFEILAKGIYDKLKETNNINIMNFADSQNFNNMISVLWKDIVYEIKHNLIDSNGDITNYSLGSEIVKLDLKLIYHYV